MMVDRHMQIANNFSIRLSKAITATVAVIGVGTVLAGCGGAQDVTGGGLQQNLGGDLSAGFNTSLASRNSSGKAGLSADHGTYPMIETSFELSTSGDDPFDFEKVNVQISLKKPDGALVPVPAFFDGGKTWRMRYTPTAPGTYAVTEVKLNGTTAHESHLEKKDWNVSGRTKPGFVRIDRGNHTQFVMDNGEHFFPIGQNAGWEPAKGAKYAEIFGKMHESGENWSRLWLDQRDGSLLEAAADSTGKPKPGNIDMSQAKRWDAIFAQAEKNQIYFQLILEHSSALSSAARFSDSSNVLPAWDKNPLNSANGGPLKSPDGFFVDTAARQLEKRKLYYILARWGYSPSLMSLELFHDVQNTDAGHGKHWDDIAMWHREMSIFARTVDVNHHLITTSSAPGIPLDSPIWETTDYVQSAVYSNDLISALSPTAAGQPAWMSKKLDKPCLVAEFGAPDAEALKGEDLHAGLWSGIFSGISGGAQYWDWEAIEKGDLYSVLRSGTEFITASALADHPGLTPEQATITTTQKGALSFSPGIGAASTQDYNFVVGENGPPAGFDKVSPILPGKAGLPKPLSFQLNCTQPSAFKVVVARISKGGAKLHLSVDGKSAERSYAAASDEKVVSGKEAELYLDLSAGAHTVTVSNDGADWLSIRRFTIANYAPALMGIVKSSKDYAVAWIYNRDGMNTEAGSGAAGFTAASGRLNLEGLQKNKYRAIWWDTAAGKQLDSSEVVVESTKQDVEIATPPITRDVALYVVRAGIRTASTKSKRDKQSVKPASLTTGSTTAAP